MLRAGGLPVDGVAAVAVLLQREVAVPGRRLAVVVLAGASGGCCECTGATDYSRDAAIQRQRRAD